MTGSVGNAWQETALVSIAVQGGAEVAFESLIEEIDFDGFEKGFDLIHLINGGNLEKLEPEGKWSVTLTAYSLDAGTDTGTTAKGFFDLLHQSDATQPVNIEADRGRQRVRICVLWSDGISSGNAAQAATFSSTVRALRFVGADGFVTKIKPSFSAGEPLKFEITIEGAPFDEGGTELYMWENISGTGTLAAIASYTSSATGIVTS